MIYFSSASYSKRNYARFRSAIALERFIAAEADVNRASDLRWARAWSMVVRKCKPMGALSELAGGRFGSQDD